MTARPWDPYIPEEEQKAYRAVGFGRSSGFGKRPALLIIDVQYRTVFGLVYFFAAEHAFNGCW